MTRSNGIWMMLLLLALPAGIRAQEGVWTVQSNKGWIGITFTFTTSKVEGEESTVVVIDQVAEGSPAEAAGILAGDTLTHLDGQPISPEVFSSLTRTLEVGDLVRMTILRDHRSREVLVEAASQRPVSWQLSPNSGEMVVRLNSVRGAILESLDSLRLSIAGLETDSLGNVSISILELPEEEKDTERGFYFRIPEPGTGKYEYITEFSFPDVAPTLPFEAMVIHSQEGEDLREELRRIRRDLTVVRRAELARLREIQTGARTSLEEVAREDDQVRELRAREAELVEEQRAAAERLRRVSEETMRRQFAEIQAQQEEAARRAREIHGEAERQATRSSQRDRDRTSESFRAQFESRPPTAHIIVGQSFVAGAQLTRLNPALAEYFQVERGVLVTEVIEGTPAYDAGLQGGDVIVRVGREDVSSLEELRFYIGYLDGPIRLRVVRKGDPVQVTIRR